MISIDLSLCTGCGSCVDVCPTKAISLVHDQASIDAELCDGCGHCIQVCPNQALALVTEPEMAVLPVSKTRTVTQPATDIIDVESGHPVPWRLAVRPAVGAFLSWAGHELIPRFVPLALDALEAVLERQAMRPDKDMQASSAVARPGDRRQRQRRRHRHGRTPE